VLLNLDLRSNKVGEALWTLEDKLQDTCVGFDLEFFSSFQELQRIMLPCSLELGERNRPAARALIKAGLMENMSKLKDLQSTNERALDIIS